MIYDLKCWKRVLLVAGLDGGRFRMGDDNITKGRIRDRKSDELKSRRSCVIIPWLAFLWFYGMACLVTIGARDDLFMAVRLLCFCIGRLTIASS